MSSLEALLLGVVEGLTEFLPVSSTAHLMVIGTPPVDSEESAARASFNIAIQLGAILAVLVLYWRSFLLERAVLMRVIVAFVPTMLLGLLFYRVVKDVLLQTPEVACWSLGIGGIVIILFETLHGEKAGAKDGIANLTWLEAALIGTFQAVAMVPGVSRSAATVLGAMSLGVRRSTAVEFSFLLAVPTIAAATAWDLIKSREQLSSQHLQVMGIGLVAALVTGLVALRLLIHLVKSRSFIGFGIYRIIAAVVFAVLFV